MDFELKQGIDRLTQLFESRQILKLSAPQPIRGRMAYYFAARANEKEWLFTLSHEALTDLPAMKSYQEAADRFARGLESRLRNKLPELFYCASGVPVLVQVEWPLEPLPNRAASCVRVGVTDNRDGRVAHCYVVITHQQSIFDLKVDPFLVQESVVNSIRLFVDSGKAQFYPPDAHPIELQEVKLSTKASVAPALDSVDKFLREKVVWLAFKNGGATDSVWVADPWDADYLGTSAAELKRSAQVLDARSELQVDASHEFASVGRELLARMRDFERGDRLEKSGSRHANEDGSWDVFICHASEDKDSLVRPLAATLTELGFRVWFDEYTLRVGDSLTRSIDQGLSRCKFGIVVLSPAFFSKEWPQKELGGLVSRESGGQKVILPVWHNLTANDVRKYSPMLSDRYAVSSSEGLSRVVEKIVESLSPPTKGTGVGA
jgi:hypothetical protein